MVVSKELMLNGELASELVESIDDPALKKILSYALGEATMRFIKWKGMSSEQYQEQLPDAPFDLAFYVKLVRMIFRERKKIISLLSGEDVEFDSFLIGDP